MKAKEHYQNHLAHFYTWMTGDFDKKEMEFRSFCIGNNIIPSTTKSAIDLGAGNGIQSVALAKLGFKVTAIDFCEQLLDELSPRVKDLPVSMINDDIRNLKKYKPAEPELIVCCGDTITHLESLIEAEQLIADASEALSPGGKLVLSFRDYSKRLYNTQRFIPVKSDASRILTCVLEYFEEKVRVTDLLYELENGRWEQKVSFYYKLRLSKEKIAAALERNGFSMQYEKTEKGMITLVGQKER